MSMLKGKPFALLVWFNFFAAALHLTDNVLFFERYPEPDWLNAHRVDAWGVLALLALMTGWLLARRQRPVMGLVLMMFFAISSLLVIAHYRYGTMSSLSFRINFFIWLEFVAAVPLTLCLFSEVLYKNFRKCTI